MVPVAVGDDDELHLRREDADFVQGLPEGLRLARRAGVDEQRPLPFPDQIGIIESQRDGE